MLDKVKGWLSGKRSYLTGAGLIALGGATLVGWVDLDPEQAKAVQMFLGGSAVVFLRAAFAKLQHDGSLLGSAVKMIAEAAKAASQEGTDG